MKKILLFQLLIFTFNTFAATKIVFLKGKVLVNGKPATKELKLVNTDSIETMNDGLMIVNFNGVLTLKIKENSKIELGKFGVTEYPETVNLVSGSLFNKLHSSDKNKSDIVKYKVVTKTTVMGVRGTHFFAASNQEDKVSKDWMCVNEGLVEIEQKSTGNKVLVPEGKGVFVTENKLDEPKPYQWTKKLNWNHDESEGKVIDELNLKNIYDLKTEYYD